MSNRISEPNSSWLFTTLLASAPPREESRQWHAFLTAGIVHLAVIGLVVALTPSAQPVSLAFQPTAQALILADQHWVPLRPAVARNALAPADASTAKRRGTGSKRATTPPPPLVLPDLDDFTPPVNQRIAAISFDQEATELDATVAGFHDGLDTDPVTGGPSIEELKTGPSVTAYSVPPELLNRAEIASLLKQRYPYNLRALGVGGLTMLWILIDRQGKPRKAEVHRSSGREVFDTLALEIVPSMRFAPARNHGFAAAVWVQVPIRFQVVSE
ncbi:MAG TPA: energy transducer TonB [Longimicrobiales bacterium]|nr:energy transducer TonB [Longimicrobiales bacterium]